jgi:hypothetical protein
MHDIIVENLGPISHLKVKLERHGVTVLSGPNGAGKSIFVEALASGARGKGSLPLRDGAQRGRVEGMGIYIGLTPAKTRYSGELQVSSIEGRFNIAALVTPGIKDPDASDMRRIKSLLSMSGAKADKFLFEGRPEYPTDEFERIVTRESLDKDDVVEMAAAIARDYQSEARQWERLAKNDEMRADAVRESVQSIDMTQESDPQILQDRYFNAQQAFAHGTQRRLHYQEAEEAAKKAQEELDRWTVKAAEIDFEAASIEHSTALADLRVLEEAKQELLTRLHQVEVQIDLQKSHVKTAEANAQLAENYASRVASCQRVIDKVATLPCPTDEELEAARVEFEQSKAAMHQGVRVRDAKLLVDQEETLRASVREKLLQSEHFRACAAATDDVLSEILKCKLIKIVSHGAHPRCYVYHAARGKDIPFCDLSATEAWEIGIAEAVHIVGDDGILFIPQEAWEGVDVWNRKHIDKLAYDNHVYIVTAEATRDESDGRELITKTLSA